jgi:hypothetical protein
MEGGREGFEVLFSRNAGSPPGPIPELKRGHKSQRPSLKSPCDRFTPVRAGPDELPGGDE